MSGIKLAVTPRYDKSLPECDFLLEWKLISLQQAEKIVKLKQQSMAEIESSIDDFITLKIEQFMLSVKKYESSQDKD